MTSEENLITFQQVQPTVSIKNKRSMSIMNIGESNLKTESDRLRKDLADKDNLIQSLQGQAQMFKDTTQGLRDLILALEKSSGHKFLLKEQRHNFQNMPHNESIPVIRKAINYFVHMHHDLQSQFEKTFAEKALEISEAIEATEGRTLKLIQKKKDILKETQHLKKVIYIHTKEKESLQRISDSLQQQNEQEKSEHREIMYQTRDHMSKLRAEIQACKAETDQHMEHNDAITRNLNTPCSKRHRDILKESEALSVEIARLTANLEKEVSEHEMTQKEYEHTLADIERAKQTIGRFKQCVSRETMLSATKTNRGLRTFIQDKREEAKQNLIAQQKKNKDLERQILELQEEENMLRPYLASIEKKLAAAMLKLPSLNDIQHRGELPIEQRRPLTRTNKRDFDDAEMRNVKRALGVIKTRKMRAKTAIK